MRASDVMTTEVWTCAPGDDTREAARIMWERDCGAVPVLGEGGRVLGMITDRDIAMAAYLRGLCLEQMTVESVMSVGATTCRIDEPIEECERRMAAARVRRLPVIGPRGRLAGIVSLSDIARATARRGARPLAEVSSTLATIGEPRRPRELGA